MVLSALQRGLLATRQTLAVLGKQHRFVPVEQAGVGSFGGQAQLTSQLVENFAGSLVAQEEGEDDLNVAFVGGQ